MHTLFRSVSPDTIANAPPAVESGSCQSASSKNASRQVPVQVFKGQKSRVRCVCFYPDACRIVSGLDDGTVCIWDRKTDAVKLLRGHTGVVWGVDVSQDGQMVVSGSEDKTLRVWNGESGETMNIFEGHEDYVTSVQFSSDSRRVVSGSEDETVRVWSIETGSEVAFELIKCHGWVRCVRYSPSGDRIASGATNCVQIWDAETGTGILSIKNSSVYSLAWTTDSTHVIGGREGEIIIWNSHNGEQLRTWRAYDYAGFIQLSLIGTHLATSNWNDTTAPIFDISMGEQVTTFKHNQDVSLNGISICYSPSGQFVATGCGDGKIYLWAAPAVEDPLAKSRALSFSSFLDRPAIPLAGPSPHYRAGVDPFWDSSPTECEPQIAPHRDQQGSSLPQRVLNRVGVTFSILFTGRTTRAAQNSPLTETVELVAVAAGKDRPYAATIDAPRFNRVQKILYRVIHCRKPDEEDEEDPAANPDTQPDSSQPPADKPLINTQPQSNEMIATGSCSSTSGIPATSNLSAHVSSQPTPSTLLSFPAVAQGPFSAPAPSPSAVTSTSLSSSSNTLCPTSLQLLPLDLRPPSTVTLSPEEMVVIQELRRQKATSARVTMAAETPGGSDALRKPTNMAADSQNSAHAPYHHSLPRDDVTVASPASSAPDEADLRHAILQLQEQVDQLRQRVDDPKRKAAAAAEGDRRDTEQVRQL